MGKYTLTDNSVKKIMAKIYEVGLDHSDTRTKDIPKILQGESDEIIARYLYVNAVLDQGSDMVGTRRFLNKITEELYKKRIRIFHDPSQFWKDPQFVKKVIKNKHLEVKKERKDWARVILSKQKYNLLLVMGFRGKQITPYVALAWGAPLLNIQSIIAEGGTLLEALYTKNRSAEKCASNFIKTNEEFGLGKAIGDKACHLLMKWLIDTYGFLPKGRATFWSKNSYQMPFDTNAIRVLTMAGIVTHFISFEILTGREARKHVFQPRDSKIYIRATNLRSFKLERELPYTNVAEIMRRRFSPRLRSKLFPYILNAAVETIDGKNPRVGVLDNGLIHIGTGHCWNKNPQCEGKNGKDPCDLKGLCYAHNDDPQMKSKYFT